MLEILGVLLGLAGVFFMAFLDTCVEKYKMRKEIQRLQAEEAVEMANKKPGADDEFFNNKEPKAIQ